MGHKESRRAILRSFVLLPLAGLASCGPPPSADEQELKRLKEELKSVEAEIAGMKRVASSSGEAPPGELSGLESKRDSLTAQVADFERRVAEEKKKQAK